jgi:hypothetical protein
MIDLLEIEKEELQFMRLATILIAIIFGVMKYNFRILAQEQIM